MGLAWLVALPRESRAQIPFIGLVARDDCTAAAQLPEANLFAFRLTQGRFDQAPDVLFDETPTGGAQIGGASAPTASGALWSIPPNWQSFQRFGDHVVAIVLNEGTLHFDSGPVTTQDMAACLAQQLCSHPNAMGPLVRTSGGDRVDVMKPVIGSATIRLTWIPLAPTPVPAPCSTS